ncbi:hypothetical protein [Scytonema sp. PRP1]|uniref:hypothetical protein n=1 Tax=Scytonema sp. PRP1 TaxID=3120513 RepID=UPI002FD2F709
MRPALQEGLPTEATGVGAASPEEIPEGRWAMPIISELYLINTLGDKTKTIMNTSM